MNDFYYDDADDVVIDDEAEEIELAGEDLLDDSSDIDMVADISDDNSDELYDDEDDDEEFEYDDEEDDDTDYIDYDVTEEIENDEEE